MMLIKEWREAWKMRSVQLMALLGLGAEIWAQMPEYERSLVLAYLPDAIQSHLLLALSVAMIWARIVNQGIGK